MDRLNVVFGHVSTSVSFQEVSASADDPSGDIVVVQALRTPIGKAKRGSYKVSLAFTFQFLEMTQQWHDDMTFATLNYY